MSMPRDPSRDLLFGLLALQNGLIDQGGLFTAFAAWTRDKGRPLADHLAGAAGLDAEDCRAVDAMVARHLTKHGNDVEKSLAAIPAGRSTCEGLASIGEPAIEASLIRVGSAMTREDFDADRTASFGVGAVTGDGLRFRILRPHAQGGLGAVFVALDSELNREVALKQILEKHADDPVSRARFLLEAEVTGGLEHPGIVPVYGLGTYADGRPYYAMRFIKGDTLKEAIDRFHAGKSETHDPGRRSLELRRLLRRFTDVCNAIDYAHSRGVLHRDVKPGNIIVGRHGETLVVDWGMAKATGKSDPSAGERTLLPSSASGSTDTLPGSAMGTPAYMSPEQAEGNLDELGPRSDVYSLGATLYYLLTGRSPVTGDDIGAVLRAVQRGELAPPRQLDSSIDPDLEAVCMKAMALRPGDRYVSCRALSDDLDRWMADEPVTAWREPLPSRARRWARRNRTAVTAAGVALLAGVVGLAAVLAVQTQAKSALADTNAELTRSQAAVLARYELAVDAIATFHTGVSEDFLLKQEQFKEVRDRLLGSACDFYGKLGALLGKDSDLASRRALWKANYELARLTAKVGKPEDALTAHRRVQSAREAMAAESRADPEIKADVGRSLMAVAALLESTGKMQEAEATYRKAESLLVELVSRGAESAATRAALAFCRTSLGWLLHTTGRNDEALSAYRLARADQQALAGAPGATPDIRWDLANTIRLIAGLLLDRGKSSEAEDEFRTALAIQQKLADDNLAVTGFRSDLARTHTALGTMLKDSRKPSEAEAEYRKALSIFQKLADDNPAVPDFRSDLATSHSGLGFLLLNTDRSSEAEAEHRKALLIQQKLVDDNPAVTDYVYRLAVSHNGLGRLLASADKASEAETEYRAALLIQRKLSDDNPAVSGFRDILAFTHQNLGAVLCQMGKSSEAAAEYRKAVEIQQKLDHDNTNYRERLAISHENLGSLLKGMGQSSEAEAEYRQAMAIRQKLADDNPAVTDFRRRLALSHVDVGHLLRDLGKSSEAEAEYRKALAIRQKLADDNPAVTDFRNLLVLGHNNLGILFTNLGKASEAEAEYGKALAIYQKLADDNPTVPQFQRNLANSVDSIGWRLAQAGKTSEAIDYYSREETIRQKLAQTSSAAPADRDCLANCQTNMADVLRRSGRFDEALAACERALALRAPLAKAHSESPDDCAGLGESYLRLAQVRHEMKDVAGAAAALRLACGHYDRCKSLPADFTFVRACCHAGLAGLAGRPGSGVPAGEGANQAEKAMAVLRQAVTMGYRNPDAYRTESALDPLRDRPDFRELMMDLTMPANPFEHGR